MMNEIKDRYIKRKAHLEILRSAMKTFSAKDRAYAHTDGRIREVEAELVWLENLEMVKWRSLGDG